MQFFLWYGLIDFLFYITFVATQTCVVGKRKKTGLHSIYLAADVKCAGKWTQRNGTTLLRPFRESEHLEFAEEFKLEYQGSSIGRNIVRENGAILCLPV